MLDFRLALDDCGLMDIKWVGPGTTWHNRQYKRGYIHECLDRYVSNDKWAALFPQEVVHVREFSKSNHWPITLNLEEQIVSLGKPRKRFRFEVYWLKDSECVEIVRSAWLGIALTSNSLITLTSSLEACGKSLDNWSKVKFDSITKSMKTIQ